MGKLLGLICKECGTVYDLNPIHYCQECFGPLEVAYDYDFLRNNVSRDKIKHGPLSLWRYWDLLPVETQDVVSLKEGFTPLIRAVRLGKALGLNKLYIKNDAVNPTYSFKDRVVAVATTRALEFGFDKIACPSTGNLACSVAAYGAVAGMKTFVFIPSDLEIGKVVGAGIYGPHLVRVKGNYDDVNRLCSEISEKMKWAFVNINIRPYYAEGSKTLAFEVAEQLKWRTPDHVVVPMASGSLLTKIHKGFNEFQELGLTERIPFRISGAQAEGCCPIVTAFKAKTDIIKPVKPNTIAKSLAIGNPADGYYAWKTINQTGGVAESANDQEIIEGIKLLARTEGIFTETAGGVTIAVLKKLAQQKIIREDDRTVAFITGNGLKTIEAVTDSIVASEPINPTLAEFDDSLIEHWLTHQPAGKQPVRKRVASAAK